MKTGIVCEGGGMRCIYTAGVLQNWMDEGFMADMLVGISAGASTSSSYVAGQSGRMRRTYIDYCRDKRYVGLESFLRTGSVFGMDFLFGELPETLDPFDFETFYASPCDYFAGATDVDTGEIVYFGKEDIQKGFYAVRASCSLPGLSPIVEFKGGRYLDGGVACPIPVQKALDEGCDRLVIVLTRPRGYQKKPSRLTPLHSTMFKQYPKFKQAMLRRHEAYNACTEQVYQLEKAGLAVVVAPENLAADRTCKNIAKLEEGYAVGLADGAAALQKLARL